jgi:hypothetical protein
MRDITIEDVNESLEAQGIYTREQLRAIFTSEELETIDSAKPSTRYSHLRASVSCWYHEKLLRDECDCGL